MAFRDDILPSLDAIRGIPGELGLRRFAVSVLVRTHSGARPGISGGTWTDVTTAIKVAGGTQNPKVEEVTARDVVASGGLHRFFGDAVVDQYGVALFHGLHVVSGLEITHAVPFGFFVADEVVEGEFAGFGFHQPVVHFGLPLRSFSYANMKTCL